MERDRAAVLTIRAAVTGVVDYSKAQLLDRKWWLRHKILTDGLNNQEEVTTIETVAAFYRALVSNAGISEESFTKLKARLVELLREAFNAKHPWLPAEEQNEQQELQELSDAWFTAFNVDKNDPDWRAKEQAKIDRFLQEAEIQDSQSDEAQLARVRERLANRRA